MVTKAFCLCLKFPKCKIGQLWIMDTSRKILQMLWLTPPKMWTKIILVLLGEHQVCCCFHQVSLQCCTIATRMFLKYICMSVDLQIPRCTTSSLFSDHIGKFPPQINRYVWLFIELVKGQIGDLGRKSSSWYNNIILSAGTYTNMSLFFPSNQIQRSVSSKAKRNTLKQM